MIPAEERYKILVEFNDTAANYPYQKTVVELFEEQVAKTPEAIALVFKQEQLTYKELNEKANQLGHYLRSIGVKEETLVPLCISRSIEMIIGILGVLKAGAAYVPIDPEYPAERINFILKDTNAAVVLTNTIAKIHLQPIERLDLIKLDEYLENLANQPKYHVPTSLSPKNLCYIIYTSGSTGQPKGVMIEHTSIINYLLNSKVKYINEKQNGSGSFIHLSYSFDASLTGIFMPLLFGKAVIIGSENSLDIFEDDNLSRYAPYDFIKITPSHLQLLLSAFENTNGNRLTNKLVIGGEALHLSYFNDIVEKGIDVEIVNEYGPTEATVGCSVYSFTTLSDTEELKNNIPIGRPIGNTQVYIVDELTQLLPIGVVGEICIGGAGIARGYLNRPKLTAEKFIQNPFDKGPGSKLYRTGDLGKWQANGHIEYHGRKDDQVKIRGYRIELGEIESALRQHPSVQQVVVIVREDSPNDKRLAAYVVPSKDNIPAISDLQLFLTKKLPEYMLPSAFVFLKSMPLTTNGKVDRTALPAPDHQRQELKKTLIAPRSSTEITLKKIWEECLKVHPIGMQDNFFELGGHSIQAVQIFSKIRKTFSRKFPLATLFQAPTIEQLAILVTGKKNSNSYSSLVAIQPCGSKNPLFCMHAGAGTVLLYQSLSQHLGMDQPVYGLQAKGLNGNEPPQTCVEDMATHSIKHIRNVQQQGPYFLAGYCFGGILAFEIAQQLIRQGQTVALLVNFNGVSPTYVHPSHLSIIEEEGDLEENTNLPKTIKYYWKKFIFLTTREKILYPFKFLIRKLLTYNQQYKIRKFFYSYYISRNRPLPEALRKYYFFENNGAIARAYKPQPFPGKMIILRSPKIYPDPSLGWDGLVTGDIETCDISGEHKDRRQIMNEPFIKDTAEKLNNYLKVYA
ncbi:MAG: amino acid adenylation domain-containing protein [Ginsengibacter sp.]